MASVVWFRRDLRTRDHPALLAADPQALGLFVLDKRLTEPAGAPGLAFLYRCLRDLDVQLNGRLLVVSGDPVELVPRIAQQVGASSVHVSADADADADADAGPYGRERDENVEKALGDIDFVRSGSPYAVTPGRVTKQDGKPYKVFTPFARAWAEHGWRRPAVTDASTVDWIEPPRQSRIPQDPTVGKLPEAGEQAALKAWASFRAAGTGTDAAPYFRVFNPTTQGEKFDPDGDYVRRFVAELKDIPGKQVHRPGAVDGYPGPIVDHAHERQVALVRYNAIKQS
jgi:deoxyribodipyrimidine photo-lyase